MGKRDTALSVGLGLMLALSLGTSGAATKETGSSDTDAPDTMVSGAPESLPSALVVDSQSGSPVSPGAGIGTPEVSVKRTEVLQVLKSVQTFADKRDDDFVKKSRERDKKRREEEAAGKSRAAEQGQVPASPGQALK